MGYGNLSIQVSTVGFFEKIIAAKLKIATSHVFCIGYLLGRMSHLGFFFELKTNLL
jgi:hypothetical protein